MESGSTNHRHRPALGGSASEALPARESLLPPVAVAPPHQRRGIGSRLIERGLHVCRSMGGPFVVVLGEPDYYARFGFERASLHGLSNEYGVDEPFMVLPMQEDTLPRGGGLVRYAPEFAEALLG
jgi:putative acetyltransferase